MRKEQNGHVYDTERSIVIGTHKYADRQRGNEIVTEKLYQTVSGQYFIFGQGGMYVHTEGNFWSRRKVDWMILPKDKHFAETWLRDHCGRELGAKEWRCVHPSAHYLWSESAVAQDGESGKLRDRGNY